MSNKAMMVQASKPSRVFTVAEANAMLPLVRAITRDLVRLSREVVERHQRVEHLKAGRNITSGDPYDEELAQIAEELTKDRERLHEYVQELRQLGVEPKSGADGIVDFPAMMDGELVFLCWKYGEREILYWHSLDGGFSARQPLATAAIADHPAPESN
jgi:hypothetical protein